MAFRKVNVILHNHTAKVKQYVNKVLAERLNAVSADLTKELKEVVSKPGPSKPGQPPGITQRYGDERVPGGLKQSIQWVKDGRLKRRIGTPLPRGFWMEMGVRGRVVIKPKRARVLIIPVAPHIAQAIKSTKKKKKGGAKTPGFIGLFQHANGAWYIMRSFVIQGPIAPRPWIKPTMLKNLKRIGLTVGAKID